MPDTPALTPDEAFALLAAGNERFASGRAQHPHTDLERIARAIADPPAPVAVVLGCIDSRVPVERVFDLGVGDLFVVRVAGNVATAGVVGSIELALGACPAIVVLGHTGCLAVRTACAGRRQSHAVRGLTRQIGEVADAVRAGEPGVEGDGLHARVEAENVRRTMDELMSASTAIREAIETGRASIAGAVYETDTGWVRWLDEWAA